MKKEISYIDLLTNQEFKSWVIAPNFEKNLFWEKQLKDNPKLQEEAKKAKELILRLNFDKQVLKDSEKSLLLEQIIKSERKHQFEELNTDFKQPNHFKISLLKIAATITIILVAVYFLRDKITTPHQISEVKDTLAYIVKSTPKGIKTNLSLPDGSKVKVNADSEIRFPDSYLHTDNRTVYLRGEAFFDVQRNEHKPFKVFTEKLEIEVLGTSFDVKSYPEFNKEYIAVATGKVEVKSATQKVILLPGEIGIIDGDEIKVSQFDREKILSWKDGILYYKNENFDEVIRKLELWYGVDFEISGARKGLTHFSGKYDNKPLATVLEGLSFAAGFKYKILSDSKVKINF